VDGLLATVLAEALIVLAELAFLYLLRTLGFSIQLRSSR